MYAKFASLLNPSKIGYVYDSRAEWTSHTPQVAREFRVFDTYGDGNVQHSADFPIGRELMADYLASLATAMQGSDELVASVASLFLDQPSRTAIEFAATVKFKDTDSDYQKQRYVSMSEQKIGPRKRCEFDKRYVEIKPWMDGSALSIYRLLMLAYEYPNAMQCYRTARAVYDWYSDDVRARPWCQIPPLLLEWVREHEDGMPLEAAFEACYCLAQARRNRKNAEGHLGNFTRWQERKQQEAAALAQQAEAKAQVEADTQEVADAAE